MKQQKEPRPLTKRQKIKGIILIIFVLIILINAYLVYYPIS